MEDRRTFLKAMGATLAAPMAIGASDRVFGANGRVQMGVIGVGTRGNQVHDAFMHNKDVTFVAACDVQKNKLSEFVQKAQKAGGGTPMAAVGDYRRLLDNKDVEAVLITTPDHWHGPILADALAAGKDVYVEKPVSNGLAPALKMIADVRASKQVVQVGCQQRDWAHFQDWQKKVIEGYIGPINHCVLLYPGGGSFSQPQPEQPQTPPANLDWEMFQGPAPRKPYSPNRLRWRSYWDYGGGAITDWGVHLTDVMLWYMNADATAPALTSASAIYTSGQDPKEVAPDTFSITWNYGKFVATLTNATPPSLEDGFAMPDMYGNYFYGQKGVLLVNRFGWELRPQNGRRGGVQQIPLKAERDMDSRLISEDPEGKGGSATVRHTRNFLDCVKSRQKPSCPIEVGFNSTLPTLLAIESIHQKKMITWDGKQAHPA
jgi:predicted dehydrogenase